MGARRVVVVYKLNQDTPQMRSIQDQDVIQALLSGSANPALRESVGIGGLERCFDDMKTFRLENSIKGFAECAVIVMDQEA